MHVLRERPQPSHSSPGGRDCLIPCPPELPISIPGLPHRCWDQAECEACRHTMSAHSTAAAGLPPARDPDGSTL